MDFEFSKTPKFMSLNFHFGTISKQYDYAKTPPKSTKITANWLMTEFESLNCSTGR